MITRRAVVCRLAFLAAAGVMPGGLAGCRGRPAQPRPPAIAVDEDVCDWCRMTIDDARLAAAYVPPSGRVLRFGEPGCLLAWLADNPAATGTAFLTAVDDGGWIDARSATLARGVVRTPMRFDLAAWRTLPSDAGEPTTWDQLRRDGRPHARRD
jgi:hypothetical protein